jgi:hypothetical protein
MTAESAAVTAVPCGRLASSLRHLNGGAVNNLRAVSVSQAVSVMPSQEVRARKPTFNRTSGGDRESPHAK